MNTMTHEQALEVLKHLNPCSKSELSQALTIAIEFMDLKVCTGCGHKSTDTINAPHLACCPDSNYIHIEEYLNNSVYKPIAKKISK